MRLFPFMLVGLVASGIPHTTPAKTATDPQSTKKPMSVYSDVSSKSCRVVETVNVSGRPHAVTIRCKGAGGYDVLLHDEDDRMSATVVTPNGRKFPLNFWTVITKEFSEIGTKAEWRMIGRNGTKVPIAIIMRVYSYEKVEKPVPYLAVAKITPKAICVTDRIRQKPNANVAARKAADTAQAKPCLK